MKICIDNLKVKTIIGVNDFERKKKQKIFVDIEIEFDLPINFNDSIKETVDYDIIIKDLKNFIEKTNFYTLEKLSLEIIEYLFKKEIIKSVKCKIRKSLKFKNCKTIYVEETRTK